MGGFQHHPRGLGGGGRAGDDRLERFARWRGARLRPAQRSPAARRRRVRQPAGQGDGGGAKTR
eukprot:8170659-Lingulodinium_polyedra.AAC.1